MSGKLEVSEENLASISGFLREAEFQLESAKFEATQQKFEMTVWPVAGELVNFEIRRISFKPWKLVFSEVRERKIEIRDKVPFYQIATVTYSKPDKMVFLDTNWSVTIQLSVGEVKGLLEEVEGDWEDFLKATARRKKGRKRK
jgi:hypothetical protein